MRIEEPPGCGIVGYMMVRPPTSLARVLPRLLSLLVCMVCCDAAVPPAVPDPLGLGERLALIDYLQETYGIHPAAGETLEDLQQRYVTAWTKTQVGDPAEVADQRERVRRLRQRIADQFQTEADTALDEAGLVELLHRLEDERRARDQAIITHQPVPTADPPPSTPPSIPAPHANAAPAAHPASASGAAHPPAAMATAVVKRIVFQSEGVSDCLYWNDGTHALLMTIFGNDHNGAFQGLPEATWSTFRQSKEVHRAVALLGHGNGTGIGYQSIEGNLKAHKEFYESLGGQTPAQPIECLLFASCSEQNADQMSEMRDGLGYYPIWKVAAGSRNYMNGPVFLAALQAVINLPASSDFRGFFRFGASGDSVSSIGEVGENGLRGQLSYWRVIPNASGFTTIKQP
jgi:hypothetical protein